MNRTTSDRRRNSARENDLLDLSDIAKQVLRRKALLALLFAAPAFLGFVYISTRPDVYTAKSAVVLEDTSGKQDNVENALPGMTFDNMTLETQANVLKSSGLMRDVISKLNLHLDGNGKIQIPEKADQPDAEADTNDQTADHKILSEYAKGLTIFPVKSSRVIEISYKSGNPYLSSELANAHAAQYVESQVRLKREQAEKLNDWVFNQIEILKKQSAEKDAAVQKFREENGIVTGRNSEDLIYQQISDIAAELVPVESRKLDLQARNDEIKSKGADTALRESSVVQSLKTQAATARAELQALSAKYGKNHPLYVEAEQRVAQLQSDINRESGSIRQSVKSELETVTAQEQMLKARLEELKKQADGMRQTQVQLKTLEFESEASAKALDGFLKRAEEISSNIDFARPDARVVTVADVPVLPDAGKKAIMMVAVLFLSAAFSLVVTYLISLADKGLKTGEAIRSFLNLRLLGILPDVKNPLGEVARGNRSAYTEELKSIYLQLSSKPSLKTVHVTAASAGEGKTSMVLALASYLVSTGRKAIVVDADIHTPDVGRLAGVDETTGLADVLAGRIDLPSAIRRDERGINILPAGSDMSGKLDLVGGANAFSSVLETLKGSYDYVLIDTAPILESSDAGTVASLADQTIMVVAAGHTSKADLKRASDRLRQFAKEYPAAILNKADLKDAA